MVRSNPGRWGLDILEQAARTAEKRISTMRVLFCLLVGARFVILLATQDDPNETGRAAQMLPATASAIIFSFWMFRRLRRPDDVRRALLASVVVDAVVCSIVIASNVVWPFPGYQGVLLLPETATVLALTMAAGYRVYPRLALVGVVLNGGLLAIVISLDLLLNEPNVRTVAEIGALYAILLIAAGAVAVSASRRTLVLVQEAKTQALRIRRAERELGVMLMDHHDASSLLSAVRFDLDRLRTTPDADALRRLEEDLDAVDETIGRLRQRAHAEALALCPVERFDLARELASLGPQLERVVAPMKVRWQVPAMECPVVLTGGTKALRRVLLNLLTNAKEGNGQRGATEVEVRITPTEDAVRIDVADNGPGYRPGESKAEGTGTGLALVASVVEASGGSLSIGGDEGGAVVSIQLSHSVVTVRAAG